MKRMDLFKNALTNIAHNWNSTGISEVDEEYYHGQFQGVLMIANDLFTSNELDELYGLVNVLRIELKKEN